MRGKVIRRYSWVLAWSLAISASILGCKEESAQTRVVASTAAQPIGHAECAACGMVVREQPAPRIQVVHRDGERAYFCSIGDSLHYLAEKNAHGAPAAVYVEALGPNMDPQVRDTKEHPWVLVSDAMLVTGVKRPGVMGEPVLAFRTAGAAEKAAERHGGAVAGWSEVKNMLLGGVKGH